MSGKTASIIAGVCGAVGFIANIGGMIFGDKATEYEINKILDKREEDKKLKEKN